MHSIHSDGKAKARGVSAVRLALIALISLVGAGFGASACLDRPLCDKDCRPRTTNIFVDTIEQNSVDKIDLLFMIDNSASMADKQLVLKDAVPDLVNRLVTPICVDVTTGARSAAPQPGPNDKCGGTDVREFNAIKNIHIGIVTSSLGDHGAHQSCNGNDADPKTEELDDHGHLLGTRPRWKAAQPQPQPAEAEGFLDWNPGGRKPAGQSQADFNLSFQTMVFAAGEVGCGYEAQLEAVYRFLVDPNPPQSIIQSPCPGGGSNQCAFPGPRDTELINERTAFLRPDSLVAIIMLTDENDCSIKDSAQFYYATVGSAPLPRGSSACVTNPNDPCCYPCSGGPPKRPDGSACPADPSCAPPTTATPAQLDVNLRCFHEKQRFGIDFLYPYQKYVNALKNAQLCTSHLDLSYNAADPNGSCPDGNKDGKPDLVPNPLYNNGSALPRPSSLVFLAGILGVPWQDIQATKDKSGTDYTPAQLASELHYKTDADLNNQGGWDVILGDPSPTNPDGSPSGAAPVLPRDGLMVENNGPRSGSDYTGKPIPGPAALPADDNLMNHHDWKISQGGDLEYACIFELPAAQVRDCAAMGQSEACDCGSNLNAPGDNNPLCQTAGSNPPVYGTTQYEAKGYPGVRELQVLKDFGANSIVASICARNLKDTGAQDYGYRPAVDAIIDRLKDALTGQCLPRKLQRDPKTNQIPCSILELTAGASDCSKPGRTPAADKLKPAAIDHLRAQGKCDATGTPKCSEFTICQLKESDANCHQAAPATPPAPGWCYVDPVQQSGDDPKLVAKCPPNEQRIINFVTNDTNNPTPAKGTQVLIACLGAPVDDAKTATGAGATTGAGGAPAATDGGP